MKETVIKVKKYLKEKYTFILIEPTYEGENGCLGIELEPYIKVIMPENAFGYNDYVCFNSNDEPYTLHRYLQPWILKDIKTQYIKLKERFQL